jgi:uncharacterized protein (DUF1499 family)
MTSTMPARRGLPLIVAVGLFITFVGVIGEIVSAFGYRATVWNLAVAFHILNIASWVTAAGGVFCLLAALATRPGTGRRGFGMSVFGLIVAAVGFGAVLQWQIRAKNAPPIHDISTDPTSLGDSAAAQQRRAYPDLGPVTLPVPPGAAFHVALAAARDMGWAIVAVDSAAGRIQATATSTWFGFKDDIAVQIGPDPKGSRVDVRSTSRVTQGDVGENVVRIRNYERRLTSRV